jgi:hypothetical protein
MSPGTITLLTEWELCRVTSILERDLASVGSERA